MPHRDMGQAASGWGEAPDNAAIERAARMSIARLPDELAVHLDGVLLIVDDFADDDVLGEMGIESPYDLTGLYSGRPIGERAETGDLPPTIHLYRVPILAEWIETGVRLDDLVHHVIVHEIGHHFGLSDDAMHALEDSAS